ncbi:MAG: pyruvate, phosphate dikinase, partial [Proteobacteria bacterium]
MESLNRYQALLFDEASKVCEGKRELMREFLGGKGAGLADMTSAGVNVPPGLTIPTAVCRLYYDEGRRLPAKLMSEVKEKLAHVEERVGRRLGDPSNPLLVSVRSGAKFSMPGMMDTILNLGLNDDTIEGLAKSSGNARFAWDSYRRFIQMYGNVVLEISKESFEEILFAHKNKCGAASDQELSAEDWRKVAAAFRDLVRRESGAEFPQGVYEQLAGAIEAVFSSWNNERAVYYRRLHGIDDSLGTAVNVQAMVFGNLDDRSATGVCFTRNPSTGETLLFGEYLVNAQGEDVVAGTRTPKEIDELSKEMPQVFEDLQSAVRKLESHYRDMQDIEFTIEQGKLYLLQTRNGKRTARAAIKIAVDLVGEGVLDKNEALKRIDPAQLNQILLPSFKPEQKEAAKSKGALLAVGLNASPGAAIGEVVFHSSEAERLSGEGHGVILVRPETCPDDIRGMVAAKGVATSRGGMTSHAAVV